MLMLGLVVGKQSTRVDDWFARFHDTPARHLEVIANPGVLIAVLVGVLAVCLYQRRWRLAAMTVVAPLLGISFVRLLKPVFERELGGGLAYPSGHVTTTVIVAGLVVLAAGAARWAVAAAVVLVPLAMLGVGITFHYFTDTVGGLLLGTSILCVSAVVAET
ncbi:phosphoesterase PA-phosphatase [Mycolicibacterium moriokaense]|nr:phosphoesterase PA-phosphatase [Mycolicibacterium moriokaense]